MAKTKTFGQRLIERVEAAGDKTPGAFNLAADLLHMAGDEADGWTSRSDDAERIPEVLFRAAMDLRERAAKPATW